MLWEADGHGASLGMAVAKWAICRCNQAALLAALPTALTKAAWRRFVFCARTLWLVRLKSGRRRPRA